MFPSSFPLFTKSAIRTALVVAILIVAMLIYKNRSHKEDLLEISRVSAYAGCMQVVNHPMVCMSVVAGTKHDALIENILDSKENEGKLLYEGGKEIQELMKNVQEGDENGSDI